MHHTGMSGQGSMHNTGMSGASAIVNMNMPEVQQQYYEEQDPNNMIDDNSQISG